MVCIYCSTKLITTNSRSQKRLPGTWRRRSCPSCNAIITTTETVDYPTALVVKRHDNGLEAFARDKLFVSLYECLKHRKTALKDATALTDTIIGKVLSGATQAQITSSDITMIATDVLKRFDKAASVQYAAYHPSRQ